MDLKVDMAVVTDQGLRIPGEDRVGFQLRYLQRAKVFGFSHLLPKFAGIGMIFIDANDKGLYRVFSGTGARSRPPQWK